MMDNTAARLTKIDAVAAPDGDAERMVPFWRLGWRTT